MKITRKQLRKIIREELDRLNEMATEAEPYNARELAAAAAEDMKKFSTVSQEWIENMWGLGKATDNDKLMDFAHKVDELIDGILGKVPPFMMNK